MAKSIKEYASDPLNVHISLAIAEDDITLVAWGWFDPDEDLTEADLLAEMLHSIVASIMKNILLARAKEMAPVLEERLRRLEQAVSEEMSYDERLEIANEVAEGLKDMGIDDVYELIHRVVDDTDLDRSLGDQMLDLLRSIFGGIDKKNGR